MAESEEEVDVLVQRVVKDITNAFKRNPNMYVCELALSFVAQSFSLVYATCSDSRSKSPGEHRAAAAAACL